MKTIEFEQEEINTLRTLLLMHTINISKQQKTPESTKLREEAENLFKKLSQ